MKAYPLEWTENQLLEEFCLSPWLVAIGVKRGHAYESGAVNLFSQLGTLTRLLLVLTFPLISIQSW